MTQNTKNETESSDETTAGQATADQATVKPDLKAVVDTGVEPEAKPEPTDPEGLREQVAQTREDLGDTVAALAAKADVKERAKVKLTETKAQAQETYAKVAATTKEHTPQPVQNAAEKAAQVTEGKRTKIFAGVGVALAALLTTLKLRKRRS